jgi:SAM-dependent methyltransferase
VRFGSGEPDAYARVRDVLRSAGYTDAGVVGLIGSGGAPLGPRRAPPLLRRTSGGSPLETLVRLFIIGVEVPGAAAEAAVAPMAVSEWADVGLLQAGSDGGVRATAQLRCFQDLVVASDWPRTAPGDGLAPDFVMGISTSTLSLASLTVRHPYRRALDLGTGSGFHALMAAAHTDAVVATDRNPRAVEFARGNAALNGLPHVDARAGDLFAPVEGERFDLIVSNPPFIISPDFKHLFLSTELKGDELCQRLAREAPAFLDDGGWCQFLANWAILRGQPWEERLAGWFDGTGCEVWANQRTVQAPDAYAATWIEMEGNDIGEFTRFFDTWMAYYDEQGIEGVGFGLITMRKGGGTWFRADTLPPETRWGAGEDVERCFLLHDLVERTGDRALLDVVVRLGPDVALQRTYVAGEGGWQPRSSRVSRQAGLGYSAGIDEVGAEVLGSCAVARPVREVVAAIAAAAGRPVEEVTGDAIAIVRTLLSRGILVADPPA